jgi:hypothetical protein
MSDTEALTFRKGLSSGVSTLNSVLRERKKNGCGGQRRGLRDRKEGIEEHVGLIKKGWRLSRVMR